MSKKDNSIVPINPLFRIPSRDEITPVDQISGKNPPAISLKEHPEFDGQKIIIMGADVRPGTIADSNGEMKPYILAACVIYPPSREPSQEDARVLMTGAGNVFARILDSLNAKAFPIEGTLRRSGRAWFID